MLKSERKRVEDVARERGSGFAADSLKAISESVPPNANLPKLSGWQAPQTDKDKQEKQ